MSSTSGSGDTPHAVADPVVTKTDTAVEERRTATRVAKKLTMNLTPIGGLQAHRCTVENISEGGLYLRVPADVGLSVGQRYEATFTKDADSPQSPGLTGESCYATVVRTKRLAEGPEHVIGAGLRFDQPLFL